MPIARVLRALTLLLVLSVSCGSSKTTVTGVVNLRDRQTIPAGAVIEVEVVYSEIADGAAEVKAKQTIRNAKGTAVNFSVPYNPKSFDSKRRYVAEAQIVDQAGKLLFRSGPLAPVITLGNSTKDISLTVIRVESR